MIRRNPSFQLSTLAIAISSALFLTTALADGGAAGTDGNNVTYGAFSQGVVGTSGDGGDGLDITQANVINSSLTNQTSTPGGNGVDGFDGGGGAGGQGGGAVFGGFSSGGPAGLSYPPSPSNHGGNGGAVFGNTVTLTNVTLTGADGGTGGFGLGGGGGAGGQGGGSVFGGFSSGGPGGYSDSPYINGGSGGAVSGNTVTLTNVTLSGADGGTGGGGYSAGAGAGGQGGGSVFGGFSSGGAGGYLFSPYSSPSPSTNGGDGGAVFGNTVTLTNVTLTGADGGTGGGGNYVAGAGGQGGGSVFGGLSSGGVGGYASSSSSSSNGGNGGDVSGNTVTLTNVTLMGGHGGMGGAGSGGVVGQEGGSVFGGFSGGGAGGYSPSSSNGGNGGDVSGNTVTISGTSSISGSVYGGYSQGGPFGTPGLGTTGLGGSVENNTVTLEGANLTIAGSVFGGYSVNGDGTVNNSKAFTGNTLNLNGYRGSLTGIYNFEQYNWVLPKNVVNQDTLITITGPDKVKLDNTQHTVAMENDGNRLNAGDTVTLIDKAEGSPTLTTTQVTQGHFIIYDASLNVVNNELVLSIDGKEDTSSVTPAGRLNSTSKAFLEGRAASLAITNQGADLISDYGISAARSSLQQASKNGSGVNLAPFTAVSGGSSRYSTGSHVDVRGFSMVLGVATGFELKDQSAITLGVFAEHGSGNYDSYNSFSGYDTVHGGGDSRYTGGGVLFHMDVAGTGLNKTPPSNTGAKDGLYIDASLRTGTAKMSFDSNDLTDAEGVRGQYNSKSKYYSASGGVGYVLNLDEKQSLDAYSRYTWGKQNADKVNIGNDELTFGASQSSRARVGTRYSYAYTPRIKPYAGVAYEHEFKGDVSGSAYDLSIEKPSLSGNTGIAEVGVSMNPLAAVEALSVDVGMQGYLGDREGATGSLKVNYAF
ncbi:autotransporter [Pseudomonas sp. TMP25]|uniref:autotransporter n=1 Tax=Pseudomonas sp. TMP25 TaxID=3136561 RepID=UPI00310108E3